MNVAPLHEVVANLRNLVVDKDKSYAVDIGQQSLTFYKKVYGKNFTKVLDDFSFIIRSLEDWFSPSPLQDYTIFALAEFMLMGAIDSAEIRADLFTSPPLIPKELLARRMADVGIPYFETAKQPPRPLQWNIFTYNTYDISERLQAIVTGIQNAKHKRGEKPIKN